MKWRRLGHVFRPDDFSSFSSHAQVPTPFVMEDRVRVYYAARHRTGKSYTTYVDLDLNDPTKLLKIHKDSLFQPSQPGTFDEDGIMPSIVLKQGQDLWLYYSGWNQKVTTPYHNTTGLGVSYDGGNSFQRMFEGPILDRTPYEPYIAVTPTILKENDDYKMWYVSGTRWAKGDQKFEPVYVIKYAHSKDGIFWERPNIQCIASENDFQAFSRPTVFKYKGLYHMYFCHRGTHDFRNGSESYKFGYAISQDGITWKRDDSSITLLGEKEGWESSMICYPFYFEVKDSRYLIYNGNGFGQSGFGILKLEE